MTASRTNILLITSDQQHWNTLGCLNPEIHTPHLDALAERGTLFTRAYCPNPTCTPTRASMITGKYPSQHGAYSLGTKLPETEPTIGAMLQTADYRTTLIGKAHFQPLASTPEFPSIESYPTLQNLAFWRDFHGPFYGFQHVELARNHTDESHVGQHYALWMESKGLTNWREHFQPPTGTHPKQLHKWSIPAEYHYNTWIAERTNAHLDVYAADEKPFFLWASFFDPHPSYLVPEPWDTLYDPAEITVPGTIEGEHFFNAPHFRLALLKEADFSFWLDAPDGNPGLQGVRPHAHDREALARDIAVYYGMISYMDNAIGRILEKLNDLGLGENTLVIFTSDHGHLHGHHGLVSKGPFHYEDMVRVPMIVAQPGIVPAGKKSDALQSLVDLPQTLLSLCGVQADHEMTGIDQSTVWTGSASAVRQNVIVENHHQPTRVHLKTLINARYKLTIYLDQPDGELFDLEADSGEFRNLWFSAQHMTLKYALLEEMLLAEIQKEERLTEANRHLPQKSDEMNLKSVVKGQYQLVYIAETGRFWLGHYQSVTRATGDLWEHPEYVSVRREMVRHLLFERMRREPLWMPRIHGA